MGTYGDMEYVMSLPVDEFFEVLVQALEKRQEDELRQEWLAYLPWMTEENKMSWPDYLAKRRQPAVRSTGRTDEEILTDAQRIRERAGVV